MKLSIIVPIYKVEPYIHRCIDSILAQTFTDFELILVDDGSPDNCPAICEDYAKKDSRITVIHKVNGGLSDARNAGLDIAKGEYVGFVDSDDYIHPQMYEMLVNSVDKLDADIAQVQYQKVMENEFLEFIPYVDCSAYSVPSDEIISHFYRKYSQHIYYNVWTKIYKRGIFQTIRFPTGKCHEDVAIFYQILEHASKVAIINLPLYFYLQRETGIVRGSNYAMKKYHQFQAFENICLYLKGKKLKEEYLSAQYDCFLCFCRDRFAVHLAYPEYKAEFSVLQRRFLMGAPLLFFNPRMCNLMRVMMLLILVDIKRAFSICEKYFPECIYEFMKRPGS